jgi:hypothetical protein
MSGLLSSGPVCLLAVPVAYALLQRGGAPLPDPAGPPPHNGGNGGGDDDDNDDDNGDEQQQSSGQLCDAKQVRQLQKRVIREVSSFALHWPQPHTGKSVTRK